MIDYTWKRIMREKDSDRVIEENTDRQREKEINRAYACINGKQMLQ